MEMNMSMCLYWSYQCYFIFERWESQTRGMFVLGCLISLLFATLSMASKKIKNMIVSSVGGQRMVTNLQTSVYQSDRLNVSANGDVPRGQKQPFMLKVCLSVYYLYYSMMHILMMLLIMTMNGFVIISIILGMTIGYVMFYDEESGKNTVDLPVNCGCDN